MFRCENTVRRCFFYIILLVPAGIYAQQDTTLVLGIHKKENKKIDIQPYVSPDNVINQKTDSLKEMSIDAFIQPFDVKKYLDNKSRLFLPPNPSEHIKRALILYMANDYCISPHDRKMIENAAVNVRKMFERSGIKKIKTAPGFNFDLADYVRRKKQMKNYEKSLQITGELSKLPMKDTIAR